MEAMSNTRETPNPEAMPVDKTIRDKFENSYFMLDSGVPITVLVRGVVAHQLTIDKMYAVKYKGQPEYYYYFQDKIFALEHLPNLATGPLFFYPNRLILDDLSKDTKLEASTGQEVQPEYFTDSGSKLCIDITHAKEGKYMFFRNASDMFLFDAYQDKPDLVLTAIGNRQFLESLAGHYGAKFMYPSAFQIGQK